MSQGLLVDYGGVLTASAGDAFRRYEREVGLPKGVLLELIVEAYRAPQAANPVAAFERGEIGAEEFGAAISDALAARGYRVTMTDIASRIFAGSGLAPDMWEVVRQAHDAGVRTALVSNSWGVEGYPVAELKEVFDALVISGEVGLRKPDPQIYLHAAQEISVPPERCAFVDDLLANVEAAQELGMFGVHHVDTEQTAEALSTFLGVVL